MKYDIRAHYPAQGEEKPRYRTIGMLEIRPGETIRLKIDTVPVGPGWSGWCNCFPREVKQESDTVADFESSINR